MGYQPIRNDEELIDTLRSANVFQHVSETPRHQRLSIVRGSLNNKSPVPVDDPVPTLSSICCFLQDRPELDALDVGGIFDKYDLPVIMDWSKLVGLMPRICDRVDRVPYRARNEVNADGSSGGGGGGDMGDDGSYNSASFESDGEGGFDDSFQCSTGLSKIRWVLLLLHRAHVLHAHKTHSSLSLTSGRLIEWWWWWRHRGWLRD